MIKWICGNSPAPTYRNARLPRPVMTAAFRLSPLVARIALLIAATTHVVAFGVAEQISFSRDVRPILSDHCFACHGPDEQTREAGLRLDQSESAMSVVAPGDADASELWLRVIEHDPDMVMPPPAVKKPLSTEQIETLRQWIEQGAPYDGHWSFRPIADVNPPRVPDDNWSTSPVDQFVLRELRRQGITPSAPADAIALCRRITLDLTGLPPTAEQIERFCNDVPERAVERLTERLMRTPAYGEHMAVAWLEAARYADTDGYQNDRYRYQHVWRDWVIDAFNRHMPYDQFVIEQLAGDMLPAATLRQQIATGFNRNHRINSEDGSIPEEWRTEYVADRVDTFGTVFLGLTVGCARCHDHKYDPISQQDYYQLFAYFNNVAETGVGPNNGNSPPFVPVPESWPLLSDDEDRFVTPEPVKLRRSREAAGNALRRPQPGSPQTVMVMHELDQPRRTFVLARGRYDQPDKNRPVRADVPAAFATMASSDESPPSNRLELARWLFRDDHPLTARVAANRIWQHFFGRGLVPTPDNFGVQGTPPSHPELLDYLANQLIESGWDIQAIQRLILDSQTYQQSSRLTQRSAKNDPDNRWYSRFPRVRLTAFQIRDAALASSGLLVRNVGGPSVKPYMPPKIWSAMSNNKYQQDNGGDLFRRSLYTYWRRTIPPPTMVGFNAADREVCAVQTQSTNTPLQALTLMNNKTFVEAAKWLARRMMTESDTPIDHGFRLVCGRPPVDAESKVLKEVHDHFLDVYSRDKPAAKQLLDTGEAVGPGVASAPEHAAMTMVASTILNLDEAVTKP
ncbi:Planctomycete cytochrome C [Crateriforma conspicua]|uniref:Planctomycete cytochrome C n=2 Tax=Planctomycetaceae TaxID=126 RepID=A0A5C6FX25_9PLAN|nr:Planctomycete cytochrome C [Crateriforma conspicua]